MDTELKAMISYYVDWEFAFECINDFEHMERLQSIRFDYESAILEVKKRILMGRGQMGIYWKSIIDVNI